MTDEEKDMLVEEVLNGFDFEKAHSIIYLTRKDTRMVLTIDRIKERAEKYLRLALDHQNREFWWAGSGLSGRCGLVACYDDKWGLSLNYVAVSKRVDIFKDNKL